MAEAKKGAAKKKISSAQKREKQNEKRRLENRSFKSTVRTAIRSYETALAKNDQSQSETALNHVYSLMDKGVKTGRFTIRKAARTKSRLTVRLKAE